mmetsp:Transcript_11960/g.20199  ORF Transcript_11960/g.20199 Transcript_11960/m.20199 type:complete len:94 (+) Transcript_11960:366-647(+)
MFMTVGYKLMDDLKGEVKAKTEKFLRKLHSLLGNALLDNCPQPKFQKLCDICLSAQVQISGQFPKSMGGTASSGLNSSGLNTGTFGAAGSKII